MAIFSQALSGTLRAAKGAVCGSGAQGEEGGVAAGGGGVDGDHALAGHAGQVVRAAGFGAGAGQAFAPEAKKFSVPLSRAHIRCLKGKPPPPL